MDHKFQVSLDCQEGGREGERKEESKKMRHWAGETAVLVKLLPLMCEDQS